jgi:cytochrome c553
MRCLSALALAAVATAAGAQQPASYAARYTAECAACHGPQGVSTMPLTPSLAGQPSFYAITQLFLFRQGRRDNAAMAAVAKGMSDADLRGFSEAIGKLPPPPASGMSPDKARFARGEAAARQHLCASCHGADYAGGQQVARLAQQREDYLLLALKGFKSGQRVGYTQAMNEALAGAAADDLGDLAHYLAHVRP